MADLDLGPGSRLRISLRTAECWNRGYQAKTIIHHVKSSSTQPVCYNMKLRMEAT